MANTFNFSDVFISYSRKDKAFVQKIADNLIAKQFALWVDWDNIPATVDWWREIEAGIESANVFVFIISPNSVQSDVCRQEIDHAVANQKRIVPILYEPLADDKIAQHLHPTISSHNWVIYNTNVEFETWFAKLVEIFQADIDYIRRHTRYLVRAREWEMRGKDLSFLLRGTDADEAALWLMLARDKKPTVLPLQEAYIATSVANARVEAEIRQRQQALVTLDMRTIPAFLLGGSAIAYYIWNTYNARFDSGGWRVAIGIGILFGICIAAVVLYADELIKIRFPQNRWRRFIASSIYAFVFASAAWSVLQLVYFGSIDLLMIWFGGVGLSLGFILNATFKLRNWQAFCITIIATYLPIFYGAQIADATWTNNHIPLIYFQQAHQRFTVGVPLAFFITLGGYAFAIWQELYQFFANNQELRVESPLE